MITIRCIAFYSECIQIIPQWFWKSTRNVFVMSYINGVLYIGGAHRGYITILRRQTWRALQPLVGVKSQKELDAEFWPQIILGHNFVTRQLTPWLRIRVIRVTIEYIRSDNFSLLSHASFLGQISHSKGQPRLESFQIFNWSQLWGEVPKVQNIWSSFLISQPRLPALQERLKISEGFWKFQFALSL